MLKNISKHLSPELLKALSEMGHGDTLVIADGNFPGKSLARNIVRYDGNDLPTVLDAILSVFPIDTFSEPAIQLMECPDGRPEIWDKYDELLLKHEKREIKCVPVDRFTFYEVAKKAYLVVTTHETALYANILITKGVV